MLSIERAKGRFTQSQRRLSLRVPGLNRPLIGPSQCVHRSYVFVKCIKVSYLSVHSSLPSLKLFVGVGVLGGVGVTAAFKKKSIHLCK